MIFSLSILCFSGGKEAANMEVKTSLLDNMIGVGDMVLLEPLTEDSFIENLRNRFDHNEIYVSSCTPSHTQINKRHVSHRLDWNFYLPAQIRLSISNVITGTISTSLRKHACTFFFFLSSPYLNFDWTTGSTKNSQNIHKETTVAHIERPHQPTNHSFNKSHHHGM